LSFDNKETTLRAVGYSIAETPGRFPGSGLGVVIPLIPYVWTQKRLDVIPAVFMPQLSFDVAKIAIIPDTAKHSERFLCNLNIV